MERCSAGNRFARPCKSTSIGCEHSHRRRQPPPQAGCCRRQSRPLQTWIRLRLCPDGGSRTRPPTKLPGLRPADARPGKLGDRHGRVRVSSKCVCLCMHYLFQVT